MTRRLIQWLTPSRGQVLSLHTRARVATRCPVIDRKHDAALAYIHERGLIPTIRRKNKIVLDR